MADTNHLEPGFNNRPTSIGWEFYLFFIIFGALGSIVALLFFPDTLHKPLKETAAGLGDGEEGFIL